MIPAELRVTEYKPHSLIPCQFPARLSICLLDTCLPVYLFSPYPRGSSKYTASAITSSPTTREPCTGIGSPVLKPVTS